VLLQYSVDGVDDHVGTFGGNVMPAALSEDLLSARHLASEIGLLLCSQSVEQPGIPPGRP